MPDSTTAATIGDLIAAEVAATQTLTTAQAELAKANGDVAAATTAKSKADADLASGINALKSVVFVVNSDGTATVYEPDGAGGFVAKSALPSSTALPLPAPAPTPAPSPAPTPSGQ